VRWCKWHCRLHLVYVPDERRVACAGSYKVSAFFLAKTVTTAPVEVVQVFLFAVIVYFMTGYQVCTLSACGRLRQWFGCDCCQVAIETRTYMLCGLHVWFEPWLCVWQATEPRA